MVQFKDAKGEAWTIALPFGEVKRIKAASGGAFDLLTPGKDELAERLDSDLMTFYDLLQIVCEPQAKVRGIDAEEFGLRMTAEHLIGAQRALFEAWRDFFRQLQRADAARGLEFLMTQKQKALELLTVKMAAGEDLIQKLGKKSEAEMENALGTALNDLQALLKSKTSTT